MVDRRMFLGGASGLAGAAVFATPGLAARDRPAAFEVTHSTAEWKRILTPAQYAVLREGRTEEPYTNSLLGESSELLEETRAGVFHCAGCDQAVYPSEAKYKSGTGWPSFTRAMTGQVGYSEESRLFFGSVTKVHCGRCGGHLGGVFDDGPEPRGKRHCINGLAMTFVPAA